MGRLVDEIRKGRVLVSDGAWGTFLHAKGLKPGECPEEWNLTHRQDVFEIARSYMDAGSDMIETNSFGASRIKLRHYGLDRKVVEINRTAAQISREAAGNDRIVLGSIGPTGKFIITGDVNEDELYDVFREQAVALEHGGADAACIETLSALDEAICALRAVRENTDLDVACTFTFDRTADGSYKTMMGVSPVEMAVKLVEAGADVIGTNCGNGMAGMIDIVREIRKADKKTPVLVHANAGKPSVVFGQTVFPETPADMAGLTPALIKAGADIIGGCCGTTPAHIRAIADAVLQQ
ncbi:homocysteine S-methyltransferase family protein [bacterium]|nr:homocysteine S-methyltransferase family protein [bacterium]